MKAWFIFLLVFTHIGGTCQTVRIDTLHLIGSQEYNFLVRDKLYYPIIRTGNEELDSLLNTDIKDRFTYESFKGLPVETSIVEWSKEQITFTDFKVSYNANGILSFTINAEGCGAYCTQWTDYFNYSTVKGVALRLTDVIEISPEFAQELQENRKNQFDKARSDLTELFADTSFGLDTMSYHWAMEQYDNCETRIEYDEFVLYPNHFELITPCTLPHAIRNLSPSIHLSYPYADVTLQKGIMIKRK
ncbi:MAG: hypothetical protein GC178_13895 [Flavobacteriales bacterium]|nr:hypothetical protein [Flavobacteriales bacterium]